MKNCLYDWQFLVHISLLLLARSVFISQNKDNTNANTTMMIFFLVSYKQNSRQLRDILLTQDK